MLLDQFEADDDPSSPTPRAVLQLSDLAATLPPLHELIQEYKVGLMLLCYKFRAWFCFVRVSQHSQHERCSSSCDWAFSSSGQKRLLGFGHVALLQLKDKLIQEYKVGFW